LCIYIQLIDLLCVLRTEWSQDFPGLLKAHPDTPLVEVVARLAASKVHRIFVTDADTGSLLGVVTLRDIIRHILDSPEFAA
jgi:CBS domain-containing protein